MNRIYSFIRNRIPLTTLGSLVSDLERAADNLEAAARRYYERSEYHVDLAVAHDARASAAEEAGDRAMRIATRARQLLS